MKKSGLVNSLQPGGPVDSTSKFSILLELIVLLMLWYRLSSCLRCCSAPATFSKQVLELPPGLVHEVVLVVWSI